MSKKKKKRCIKLNGQIGYDVSCLLFQAAERMPVWFATNRMGDNWISHTFALHLFSLDFHWITDWEGGSSQQYIEAHSSDFMLEGVLVYHSLWYGQLLSAMFWTEYLYTYCLLLYVSSSPNQHQHCLQANCVVRLRNALWNTASNKPTTSWQHLKTLSHFLVLAQVAFRWTWREKTL